MSYRGPLTYVANVRLPSERAHALQILAQADAFRTAGAEVSLLAPRRRGVWRLTPDETARRCSLANPPRIERVFCLDCIDLVPARLQRLPFLIQSATFALAAARRLRGRAGILYSRDPWTTAWLARGPAAPPLFHEAHDLPRRPRARERLGAALRRALGVVVLTEGLGRDLEELGVSPDALLVEPDGWSPRRFADVPGRDEARRRLALAPRRPLVVYTGHLFRWKGGDVLVAAAARTESFEVLVVGGRPEDLARVRAGVPAAARPRVAFTGAVPPDLVPLYLAAADVVAVPNSARERISARYTSPLKLFEAMAARRPVVASDLPSLREILDEETAILVEPDDPGALARGVERALSDPETPRRVERARRRVEAHTWEARGRRILEFVARRLRAAEAGR